MPNETAIRWTTRESLLRRNDRFLKANTDLRRLFPKVDFTDYDFACHLIMSLARADHVAFGVLVRGLQSHWVRQMQKLIEDIPGPVILLWMADHLPDADVGKSEPLFVDRSMMQCLSALVNGVVEVVGTTSERQDGFEELNYGPFSEPAAEEMLGPVVHRKVTRKLSAVLNAILQDQRV